MVIFIPITYYGSSVSPHIDKTPEGYLICRDVPINRTGTQTYLAHELGLDGDPDRPITVYRLEEDVFDPAALASFEGKDITRGHPPEMLTAENHANYSMGHLGNVRRVGDNTVADLIIKDPTLASDVENRVVREVSCGYNCNFEPYQDGYKQTRIRGNHLAVVPKGRAGGAVSIHDAANQAEKGLKQMKKETKEALYRFFGLAANDAAPEELEQLTRDVSTVATALDAEPAEKAQDAEPAEKAPAQEKPAGDADPVQGALDARLGKIEALLAQLLPKQEEPRMADETDLDEMISKLAGGEEAESAVTIPVENGCAAGPARDAAVELLKKVRPAVAAIEDKQARAKVTDALLSAIQGKDVMPGIVKAAMDSAQAKAEQAGKNSYEQICADSAAAYAARNPHTKKEEI